MRYAIVAISISMMVTTASAETLRELQSRSLPVYSIQESFYDTATMAYLDSLSISMAEAGVDFSDKDKAIIPQNGTGHQQWIVGATSYLHLDSETTVWGNASFGTGKIKDIKWSNCIDYELIAPYVLGDGTGGDISFRRYDFGGGYSKQISGHVSLCAAVSYRAEIAWRDVDPRINTIVSDLNLVCGTSYKISKDKIIGISATMRSYTQNCDLEFYNPLNDINTYPLTGLGTYYKRFAGNTNKNSGHRGFGYGITANYQTTDKKGLQVSLKLNAMRIDQMLRNFNNITLGFTDTYFGNMNVTYGIQMSEAIRLQPTASLSYEHRTGTENLFGTAAGASYDRIGSRTPYKRKISTAKIMLPIEARFDRYILTFIPKATLSDYTESLNIPVRSIDISGINYGISMDCSYLHHDKWLFTLGSDFYYRSNIHSDITFTEYDATSTLQNSVYSTYGMLKGDTVHYGLSSSISRQWANIIGGISTGFDIERIVDNKCRNFYTTINIIF